MQAQELFVRFQVGKEVHLLYHQTTVHLLVEMPHMQSTLTPLLGLLRACTLIMIRGYSIISTPIFIALNDLEGRGGYNPHTTPPLPSPNPILPLKHNKRNCIVVVFFYNGFPLCLCFSFYLVVVPFKPKAKLKIHKNQCLIVCK